MTPALTTFGPRLLGAGALLVVLLLASVVVRDRSTRALYEHTQAVAHTHAVINALDRVLTRAVDAETGERGYLITGRDDYLEPYHASSAALDTEVNQLATLVADDPPQ